MQDSRRHFAGQRRMPAACLITTLLCLVARPLPALDIVLNYDAANSQPPSYDPDATQLASILAAAATVWEDLIEDPGTLQVAFTWGDLAESTLGAALLLSTSRGKPTSGRIRFDTMDDSGERNWYLDPAPLDHSEFNLDQRIINDLSPAQVTSDFTGTPPDLLEVNFSGRAVPTAPDAARNDFDLFTVVMHELGHLLGMTNGVIGNETNDLDFDVDPTLIGGFTAGIRVAADDDIAHLAPAGSLMFPSTLNGVRRLPSATDVLAVATAAGWNTLDLARQDFLTGAEWHVPSNWLGNSVPDADDAAAVRHGGIVTLGAAASVNTLTLDDVSQLRTDDSTLQVADEIRIDGSARLIAQPGGQVVANALDLRTSGQLELDGGVVQTGTLDLAVAASLVFELAAADSVAPFTATSGIQLEGRLELERVAGYQSPTARGSETSWDVITAGSRSGTFSLVFFDGAPLAADFVEADGSFRSHQGNGLFRNLTYSAAEVRWSEYLAQVGDANGDQTVDAAQDGALLLANLNQGGGQDWIGGDFTGDGLVSASGDGALLLGGLAPDGATSVPEPSAALLALSLVAASLGAEVLRAVLSAKTDLASLAQTG